MYFLMYDCNDGVDLSPFSCPAIFFYDKNPSLAAGRLLLGFIQVSFGSLFIGVPIVRAFVRSWSSPA